MPSGLRRILLAVLFLRASALAMASGHNSMARMRTAPSRLSRACMSAGASLCRADRAGDQRRRPALAAMRKLVERARRGRLRSSERHRHQRRRSRSGNGDGHHLPAAGRPRRLWLSEADPATHAIKTTFARPSTSTLWFSSISSQPFTSGRYVGTRSRGSSRRPPRRLSETRCASCL